MSNRGFQRRGKKGQRKAKGPRDQDSMVIPRPLQVPNVGMTHSVKVRFVTTGTVALAITYKGLLDAICVAATSTTAYQMFDLVRVKGIEMWCYNPSGVTTLTVSYVSNTIGLIGDGQAHTAQSMGLEPAYLKAVPSSKCTASLFQPDTTYTAFNIYCPIATVIDMHLVYRTALEGIAPVACSAACVSAQPGLIYYRGIDQAPTASTKFTPCGTPQVI